MRYSDGKQRILYVTDAGMIAAFYTVLTVLVGAMGLANGAVQLRISEALCVLPIFLPAAIPGLTIGCFLANLLTGCLWQDLVFGTLATFLGAVGARMLRKLPYLAPLPTVVCNTAILPIVLAYAYHAEQGIGFLFLSVGAGEILSAYLCGILLYKALQRYPAMRNAIRSRKGEAMKHEPTTDREIPILLPPQVAAALERLRAGGYSAYAVGGCVRDSILGREPNDWDITTSARPEETAACFKGFRTVETGIRHGTLTVIADGMPLEITTFRSDGEYLDNRHPASVRFETDVREDLARRDFTVNAMAYHPAEGLVDCFGGREDLQAGVIRAVGDPATRFHEDGLRILRAIRFAAVLDFTVEEQTGAAVHACRDLLRGIAAERIREEFSKLICGKGAVRILREYSDVIAVFLPELGACVGFVQNTKYHCYDVYEHTLHALEAEQTGDFVTRLAVLLHDVGKPLCYTEDENGGHFKGHGPEGTHLTAEILRRLRFDNATAERVTALVEYHDREIPAEERAVKRLMRVFSDEDIERLVEVMRCDRVAHAEAFRTPSPDLEKIPAIVRSIRASDACLSLRTLAVNGDDLIAVGIPRGKRIGVLLNGLLDLVTDGKLPNEREVLLAEAIRQNECDFAD